MGVVVGTAGHIDHGKTTLLRALTGIDADRLPEERRRGMTIDVGYAHLVLPDGGVLDFVDVPGHDRLVGNMLVGAGEIDAAMLVVAADDGPRAQTIEHLELLDGLAIADGIVVVTKADLVDEERLADIVAASVRLVSGTAMAGAPVVAVSAASGAGRPALREALARLSASVRGLEATRGASGTSRLAVDRVFRVKGRGVVVTGTLRGAPLAVGSAMTVVPGGQGIRIRELQVHGQKVDRAEPGRVAINVAGAEADSLGRGVVLTTDEGLVTASDRWLVALRPTAARLASDGASVAAERPRPSGSRSADPIPDRLRAHVHAGTAHAGAVVVRAGRDGVDLGEGEVSAILRLDAALAVAPGDRFVLRRPSPPATLAGGRVLDPAPPRGIARRRSTPDRLIHLARAISGSDPWVAARLDLHGVAGGRLAPDVAVALDAAVLDAVSQRAEATVAELRTLGIRAIRRHAPVQRSGASRLASEAIDGLVAAGRLTREADRVRLAGTAASSPPPELLAAMDRLETALATVAPPPLSVAARSSGCPPEGVRALERANRIVRLDDDLAWAFGTYRDLAARAVALAGTAPLTPAAFRDATGTSRKYVMAILEDLDRRAILRRTEAGHVPGPRAPESARP
jgi:selenocysteine-specific elongation factor